MSYFELLLFLRDFLSLSLKFEKRKHVPHPRCRYLEVRYHRPEEIHKGRLIESRVENIVVFLPDIASSCMPTSLEWDQTTAAYKQKCAEELAEELNEAQTTVHKCFSSFFVVVSSLDLLDLMKFGIYECFFRFRTRIWKHAVRHIIQRLISKIFEFVAN